MGQDGDAVVRDNAARRRYEITLGGRTAMLTYKRQPGSIELIHTGVPPELEGRGLASKLARAALEAARAAGVRVIATCPYVRAFVQRHPEYRSLLE